MKSTIATTLLLFILSSNPPLINKDNLKSAVTQDDCTRGKPEPVIKKEIYPKASFHIKGKIGYEEALLKSGDKLTIENKGCEYYVLQFRFETSRFKADATNSKYWAKAAVVFMSDIKSAIDAPIDLNKGILALNSYYIKNKRPTLGKEIDFGEQDIRSFVTLDNIREIANSKYAVTITYTTGPL